MFENLTLRFSRRFYHACVTGLSKMSREARRELAETLTQLQGPGGLFYGREGFGRREDLYYSLFGLLLAMTTNAAISRKACAHAIEGIPFESLDLVHASAWLRIQSLLQLLALPKRARKMAFVLPARLLESQIDSRLESLRRLSPEAFPQQDAESPYSQFLLATLYADFGLSRSFTISPLAHYRLPNQLFSNLRNPSEYSVTATSAAIFLLPASERRETATALAKLQEPNGSFRANPSASGGDLLSTATASWGLYSCGMVPEFSQKSFLRSCFRSNGLFAADPEDPQGDLEYTVYGLLTMGTLP